MKVIVVHIGAFVHFMKDLLNKGVDLFFCKDTLLHGSLHGFDAFLYAAARRKVHQLEHAHDERKVYVAHSA